MVGTAPEADPFELGGGGGGVRKERSRAELASLAASEARGKAAWAVAALSVRAALSALAALAGGEDGDRVSSGDGVRAWIAWKLNAALVTAAGLALTVVPPAAVRGRAPGLVLASPWLLLPLSDWCGFTPAVPSRACDAARGRLTPRELAVILPIHFLSALAAAAVLRFVLPPALVPHAVDPVIYSEGNPWLVDLASEAAVNAAFAVAIHVVPEMLRLNRMHWALTAAVMYPLCVMSVDAEGTASAFGPDVIYALRCVGRHEEVPIGQSSHVLGPILGGLLGGKIVTWLFPDE